MIDKLKTLISKLDPICRQAAERAANLCVARGHYEVDVEHFCVALLEQPANDFKLILSRNDVRCEALLADIEQEVARFKDGNTRTPVFSPHVPRLLEQAWLIASMDADRPRIRSGHLVLALLNAPDLSQLVMRASPWWARIDTEALKHRFDDITAGSPEATPASEHGGTNGPGAFRQSAVPDQPSRTPALDQFTSDLTRRARDGRLDPVIGRDAEIRQVVDILMRRRQNNPILTGEAGVGKTAVVEGLALRIAAGDVPQPLRGVALHVLDMGLLQAGASVKGEFESRLKTVIDEIHKSVHPIILFVDEAHTMIGAGAQAGQGDAANLLKPALARGELRTIAATTWSEYKRYFEKDAALARRFQVIKVEEPAEPLAAAMLRGMVPLMERHFNVRILDEAVTDAVRLSHRYISGRQLPDKAIGVLDTACAKVALGHAARPAVIEDNEKAAECWCAELSALEREQAVGVAHGTRVRELHDDIAALNAETARLREQWERETALVARVAELRARAEVAPALPAMVETKPRKGRRKIEAAPASPQRVELDEALAELRAVQGDAPLVPLHVDAHVIAEVVAAWTGIPLGKMVKDEIGTVLRLQASLGERVIGQPHALAAIAQGVRTARARLDDPGKPKGVFLLVGPSGVGKTETALALADTLYGGERNLITINMSEYQEAHTVSGLKGSPPGYVGFGDGGILTEAVRRKPYSIVLLDEIEKAHPDVLEMFYQVLDKGVMDDSEGREIDFRNTLIILTSNVGSQTIMRECLNKPAVEAPTPGALAEAIRPALYQAFKPAFLGRMRIVPYFPLDDDALERIVALKLSRIGKRIAANHQAEFQFDESLVDAVLARCTEVDSGARNVDHILNGSLLPQMAEAVLERMADNQPVTRIRVGADEAGRFECAIR